MRIVALGINFHWIWHVGVESLLDTPTGWVARGPGLMHPALPGFSGYFSPRIRMQVHAIVYPLPSRGGGPYLVPPSHVMLLVLLHLPLMILVPRVLHAGTGLAARPAHGLMGRRAAILVDPVHVLADQWTAMYVFLLLGIARVLAPPLLGLRVNRLFLSPLPI